MRLKKLRYMEDGVRLYVKGKDSSPHEVPGIADKKLLARDEVLQMVHRSRVIRDLS